MRLNQILYDSGKHYIVARKAGGFEVYRHEVTAAVKCATIGYEGQKGWDKARAEITRREGNASTS